ncbi:hypothetical protein BC936DRAFT_147954 [Jimgerdemannia flammicorona]|uniref:Uncharacterized protein n=1 Tax=Jimgerdemannia flammicorona TaxID=994334 RepID=A0A433D465_9FUNG|nr:hypothetical protein BC936DRAFT_147954 [Jimgerdemannia flammicorona]
MRIPTGTLIPCRGSNTVRIHETCVARDASYAGASIDADWCGGRQRVRGIGMNCIANPAMHILQMSDVCISISVLGYLDIITRARPMGTGPAGPHALGLQYTNNRNIMDGGGSEKVFGARRPSPHARVRKGSDGLIWGNTSDIQGDEERGEMIDDVPELPAGNKFQRFFLFDPSRPKSFLKHIILPQCRLRHHRRLHPLIKQRSRLIPPMISHRVRLRRQRELPVRPLGRRRRIPRDGWRPRLHAGRFDTSRIGHRVERVAGDPRTRRGQPHAWGGPQTTPWRGSSGAPSSRGPIRLGCLRRQLGSRWSRPLEELLRSCTPALRARTALAADNPAVDNPAAGTLVVGAPAAGTPAAGSPAAGSSAAGSPAAGSPVAGSPAVGSPAAGTARSGGLSRTCTPSGGIARASSRGCSCYNPGTHRPAGNTHRPARTDHLAAAAAAVSDTHSHHNSPPVALAR